MKSNIKQRKKTLRNLTEGQLKSLMVNNFNYFGRSFRYDTITNRDGFHTLYNKDSGKLVVSDKDKPKNGIYEFMNPKSSNPIFNIN